MFSLPLTRPLSSAVILALAAAGTARSEDFYSPVVGFLRFDCPADSDTIVSVPFHPTPRWAGRLSGAPTNPGGGVMRLSLGNAPNFTGTELTHTPHFVYLRGTPGTEGRHFRIAAHAANSVDVTAAAAELAGLGTDSQLSILPGWTLDALFPPATQTTFHASTGNLASTRGSELLLFDLNTVGSNLAPSRTFFVTGTQWIEAGPFTEAGDEVIAPGQAFIVRHPSGVAATAFVAAQQVYGEAVAVSLPVSTTTARDTMLALPRPVPATLEDLDLSPAVFTESPSTAANDRRDQLLVFDNASVGRNKEPAAVYFRTGGQWVRDAAGFPPSGSVSIEPSAGLLLRKAAGSSEIVLHWINEPAYDVSAP